VDIDACFLGGHDKVFGRAPIAAVLGVGHDFIFQVLQSFSQCASIAEKGLVFQKREERAQHRRDCFEERSLGRHLSRQNLCAAFRNSRTVPLTGREDEILVGVSREKLRDGAGFSLV